MPIGLCVLDRAYWIVLIGLGRAYWVVSIGFGSCLLDRADWISEPASLPASQQSVSQLTC